MGITYTKKQLMELRAGALALKFWDDVRHWEGLLKHLEESGKDTVTYSSE